MIPRQLRRGRIWPISVAPMMDWTDRHYRYFMRRITRRTLLYSEMVTTGALLHGDRERLLAFDPLERPLALQLGGDDPEALAACARLAQERGFDEVDLNVGCPSDRVQRGNFGACLMTEPDTVAVAVAAMRAATGLPVTVKHRIGVDDLDRYEDMERFVAAVAAAGADRFIVHARKAWLKGLSPKQNRTVPPLRYRDVYRLKRTFPELIVEINGGVATFSEAEDHLRHVDGVMIGRAAYEKPYLFAGADSRFFGEVAPPPSRREVVEGMVPYLERELAAGTYLSSVTRHMMGLFRGCAGGKTWRRHLSENSQREGAGVGVVLAALALVPDEVLDERPERSAAAVG